MSDPKAPRLGKKGPEWRAAEESGLDMSLVEANLRLTPWERIQVLDDVLRTGFDMREALGRAKARS